MNDEINEERLDRWIREAAQGYHRPPETPHVEMWRAIRRRRRRRNGGTFRPAVRWLTWSVGVAAVLAVGIGIGYALSRGTAEEPQVATAPPANAPANLAGTTAAQPSLALTVVANQHLAQAETFLLLFRSAVEEGLDAPMAPGTARELLATNRLLSDSPVGRDPKYRDLLQDLELVLAQISGLDQTALPDEKTLITDGIKQRAVLTRLQTVVPAGTTTPALNMGVL
jgi:hypothetical protein